MKLTRLSVATFNLLNLNLPGLRMYRDANGWTPEEYRRKIAWSAAQFDWLKPDVLGLQELWHKDALAALLAASAARDEYEVVAPADAVGTQIHCAALVKKGMLVGAPEWIKHFPAGFALRSAGDDAQTPEISVAISGYSRPVLHFQIRPRSDESPIHVFVCHFKSKAPTRVPGIHAGNLGSALSTIRRTAEAAALRFLLTETMKGNDAPVIVMGDINDGMLSNTANVLTEQPRYLVGDTVGGADNALYTTQTLQEFRDTRDVYYTHVHEGMRESLDHILVSEQFYDLSAKRRWLFEGLIVNNDHLNFDNPTDIGSNDHGVVRATFKYKPAKPSL
jgi:predicted extracellular nuclease